MSKIMDFFRGLFAPCTLTFEPYTQPVVSEYPQRIQVLSHLQSGRSLSAKQARILYQVANLPARICELRKAGYKIKSEQVGKYSARGSFCRYWLTEIDE